MLHKPAQRAKKDVKAKGGKRKDLGKNAMYRPVWLISEPSAPIELPTSELPGRGQTEGGVGDPSQPAF